jgi:hypothetical protein
VSPDLVTAKLNAVVPALPSAVDTSLIESEGDEGPGGETFAHQVPQRLQLLLFDGTHVGFDGSRGAAYSWMVHMSRSLEGSTTVLL